MRRLGLAIFCAIAQPGEGFTCAAIAAFCGCTPGVVAVIERKAIAKLRRALKKTKLSRTELEKA